MIVLGEKLENPYVTETMQAAYAALYPTKSREAVSTTDYYVRFLPLTQDELETLMALEVNMLDYPMDYEILQDGDYYHDPSIDDEAITWQYAVVSKDFEFPEGIYYELIDECFISENSDAETKASGVDWEEVEAYAYKLTGNGDCLSTLTKSSKYYPSGRITIVDDDANGGQPFGLSGVKVQCNSFVKFASAYTDRDGYYQMSKQFSANPHYRLVFNNEMGFSIGLNLILVTASTSTLGQSSPEGISYCITTSSDAKMFRRAVVSNAAYDYYSRCASDDMDILTPPGDLRFWIFGGLVESSAVMLHHGAVVESSLISNFLGVYTSLIKTFLPDITIGAQSRTTYKDLYDVVCHELAHASHFKQVGTDFWDPYTWYILYSFLTGRDCYGDGSDSNAGYCEVGEMWAYYLESMMYKERYGGTYPNFGGNEGYWFYPQIFWYIQERGIADRSEIFSLLDSDVTDRSSLIAALVEAFPSKKTAIQQIFYRYM